MKRFIEIFAISAIVGLVVFFAANANMARNHSALESQIQAMTTAVGDATKRLDAAEARIAELEKKTSPAIEQKPGEPPPAEPQPMPPTTGEPPVTAPGTPAQ